MLLKNISPLITEVFPTITTSAVILPSTCPLISITRASTEPLIDPVSFIATSETKIFALPPRAKNNVFFVSPPQAKFFEVFFVCPPQANFWGNFGKVFGWVRVVFGEF